jgi:hypothetical protein
MPGSVPTVKHRGDSVMISAAISWYSVGPTITLHGRIITRVYKDRLDNQEHPMIQMLFPNNVAVFRDDDAPIHTAITVQSWFEEHAGDQHLPWSAQSPDSSITEALWSVMYPPQHVFVKSESTVTNLITHLNINKPTICTQNQVDSYLL